MCKEDLDWLSEWKPRHTVNDDSKLSSSGWNELQEIGPSNLRTHPLPYAAILVSTIAFTDLPVEVIYVAQVSMKSFMIYFRVVETGRFATKPTSFYNSKVYHERFHGNL